MFGEDIKRLRISRGLSKKALADAAGKEPQNLYSVEIGRTGKTPASVFNYAKALGCNLDKLSESVIQAVPIDNSDIVKYWENQGLTIGELAKTYNATTKTIQLFQENKLSWFFGLVALNTDNNKKPSFGLYEGNKELIEKSIDKAIEAWCNYNGDGKIDFQVAEQRDLFRMFAALAYSKHFGSAQESSKT